MMVHTKCQRVAIFALIFAAVSFTEASSDCLEKTSRKLKAELDDFHDEVDARLREIERKLEHRRRGELSRVRRESPSSPPSSLEATLRWFSRALRDSKDLAEGKGRLRVEAAAHGKVMESISGALAAQGRELRGGLKRFRRSAESAKVWSGLRAAAEAAREVVRAAAAAAESVARALEAAEGVGKLLTWALVLAAATVVTRSCVTVFNCCRCKEKFNN